MALNPTKGLHFDSWESLLSWLPEASEAQLLTVFVWSGDVAAVGGASAARLRREAFEHLVARTRKRLHQFLSRRCQCRDAHLADDVVQQVLVKVFLRAGQFDARRSFWGWLYRIARNEYIDALRRLRPGDVGRGRHGAGEEEDWLDRRLAPADTPEELLLRREFDELFEQAIAALPSLQRRIVQLKRAGMKGKEIAAQLDVSQAYVSQLTREAEELLRDAIPP